MQEKLRKCVEEHCGTGERPGLKAWGAMCLDRCRATLWRATQRRSSSRPSLKILVKDCPLFYGMVIYGMPGSRYRRIPSGTRLPWLFKSRSRPSPRLEKNYVPGMGRRTGGGWFDRGSPFIYEKTGGPLVLYGLQRSGTNAFTGLVGAHLGTEVYNGERDDEYYERGRLGYRQHDSMIQGGSILDRRMRFA